MAFIQFKQSLVRASWAVDAGTIVDAQFSPEYWQRFVDRGHADFIDEGDFDPATVAPIKRIYNQNVRRPTIELTSDILDPKTRLDLPEAGAFNPGLVAFEDGFILVYRANERQFIGCFLDRDFKASDFFPFRFTNAADPRLVWHGNKLWIFYSGFDNQQFEKEAIRGCIIMDLEKGKEFIHSEPKQISSPCLERQKNWMPFIHDERIYLIQSVCPHSVVEFDGKQTGQIYTTPFNHQWIYPDAYLKGNTNAVRLPDGNYLATFHSSKIYGMTALYDNGAYIFEGKPPFRPLWFGYRTYLPADSAVEPPFRKGGFIQCCFPTGLVESNTRLFVSYGDQDSCCKIGETNIYNIKQTMKEIDYES